MDYSDRIDDPVLCLTNEPFDSDGNIRGHYEGPIYSNYLHLAALSDSDSFKSGQSLPSIYYVG